MAMRTRFAGDGNGGSAGSLSDEFHEAEGAEMTDIMASAVSMHGNSHGSFNFAAMVFVAHFDEVDDDLSAYIP